LNLITILIDYVCTDRLFQPLTSTVSHPNGAYSLASV
jgi:hypothetical protein